MQQPLPVGLVGRPVAQHFPRPVVYQAVKDVLASIEKGGAEAPPYLESLEAAGECEALALTASR